MSRSEAWRGRASWVLLVALVATAATVVMITSNAQAEDDLTGPVPELCIKFEEEQIGTNQWETIPTTNVMVHLTNWVHKLGAPTEWVGFDWSTTPSTSVTVWVKASTDEFHSPSPAPSGTFLVPTNGTQHAISFVIVCLDGYESRDLGSD